MNLEENIVHFQANGELLNKLKQSTRSTVWQLAIPADSWPVWGQLGAWDQIDRRDQENQKSRASTASEVRLVLGNVTPACNTALWN